MITRTLSLFLLIPFFAFSGNPYDTSTPASFVASMGLIGQQAEDHNPLPYFYDQASAEAIYRFDQAGEKALKSFDELRNTLTERFPNHVKLNVDGKVKISLDGYAGMKIRTMTYSASLIGAQLRERKASDYEFVSSTEPNEEGVITLTLKILGQQRTLPLKNTENGYRMFLDKKVLDNLAENIRKIEKLNQVFTSAHEQLINKEITEENFEEKVEAIVSAYEQALSGN